MTAETPQYVCTRMANDRAMVRFEIGAYARALPLRTDIVNHSPDGFEWGYGGSGPLQLAVAILADASDPLTARTFYRAFHARFIAPMPRPGFTLFKSAVEDWLIAARHEAAI